MTEIDALVKDKLLPMRQRLLSALEEEHPRFFAAVNALLADEKNKFGMEVTENGRVVGQYVLHMDGVRVSDMETGKLDSEIHHPFLGVIKPYASVTRQTIEEIIADEQSLRQNMFPMAAKYLPGVTIKFLP